MHPNRLLPLAAAALAFTAAGHADTSRYMKPVAYSYACRADLARASACGIVRDFFRSLNSHRYAAACSLLGSRLRDETGGRECARFLAGAVAYPHPWGILGARTTRAGVDTLVTLGQSELGHERMRLWRASVGLERGAARIVATRLLR
jgi:hypothetical protein